MATGGTQAYKLYTKYSMAELVEMASKIRADPANENPAYVSGNSIYLYTPKANKKLDAIAWAVTYHLKERV